MPLLASLWQQAAQPRETAAHFGGMNMRSSLITALSLAALLLAGCVTSRSGDPRETEAEKHLLSATQKQRAGDQIGALRDLDQAIQIYPEHTQALVRRGSLRAELKDVKGATEDFDRAIEISPRYATAYFGRGVMRTHLKQEDAAVEDFTRCIELAPGLGEAYLMRGKALAQKGRLRPAIADFSEAVRIDANQYRGYLWRAYAYIALGETDRAMPDLRYVRDRAKDPVLVQLAKDCIRKNTLGPQ
jgi:tetratricopeptide (TPR) repeat protein